MSLKLILKKSIPPENNSYEDIFVYIKSSLKYEMHCKPLDLFCMLYNARNVLHMFGLHFTIQSVSCCEIEIKKHEIKDSGNCKETEKG